MSLSRTFVATTLLLFFTSQSFAGIIALNFLDPTPAGPGSRTAGEILETGTPFTFDGLTVTAVPSGDDLFSDGLLANADSFGVDSNNTPTFTDIPDDIQFDGSEQLAILFSQTIEILQIDLQGLLGTEVGRVTAGSFTIDLFTGVDDFNGRSDIFMPATPILVPNGVPVVFETIAPGAAFGLQGLIVNVRSTDNAAVPEPGSVAIWSLIGLCMAGCCSRRRRSRRRRNSQ